MLNILYRFFIGTKVTCTGSWDMTWRSYVYYRREPLFRREASQVAYLVKECHSQCQCMSIYWHLDGMSCCQRIGYEESQCLLRKFRSIRTLSLLLVLLSTLTYGCRKSWEHDQNRVIHNALTWHRLMGFFVHFVFATRIFFDRLRWLKHNEWTRWIKSLKAGETLKVPFPNFL